MGNLIVSFDCEGKWGMADHLEPYHHRLLTDEALAAVYDWILTLLGRYGIASTFAYVMAFTLSEDERRDLAHLLPRRREDSWLAHYWAAIDEGHEQGWFQPHALEAVRRDGRHEIACHGFCHRPLGDESLSETEAELELQAALTVAQMKGVELRTFIFPRNEVGHLEVLRRNGFLGYREKLSQPKGMLGQALRLAEELNVWASPQRGAAKRPGEMVRIPAGYFFNWRFGPRSWVPLKVTVRRWCHMLDESATKGGVVHLWLHPHNLITAPDTALSLERVFAYAADLKAAGRINILTQEEYCRDLLRREDEELRGRHSRLVPDPKSGAGLEA